MYATLLQEISGPADHGELPRDAVDGDGLAFPVPAGRSGWDEGYFDVQVHDTPSSPPDLLVLDLDGHGLDHDEDDEGGISRLL